MTIRERIFAALARGPLQRIELIDLMADVRRDKLNAHLRNLIDDGNVRRVGNPQAATDMLHLVTTERIRPHQQRVTARERKRKKPPQRSPQPLATARRRAPADTGGEIAGPCYRRGYRWGAGW